MQYYSQDNNERGKRAGLIATIIYMAVWLVLFLVLEIKFEENKLSEGLLIDFGTTADGSGEQKPTIADLAPPSPASTPVEPQQTITQDFEEAPQVRQSDPRQTTPANRPQDPQPTQSADQPPQEVQTQRTADPRALFPGRNPDTGSQSAGVTTGTGNQGDPAGASGQAGSGSGSEENSFDLAGRELADALPLPIYPGKNKEGKVLVGVIVDSRGHVKQPYHIVKGSTTQDPELVAAALTAASKAKFTPDENNPEQVGTITYIFKLN